MRLNIIKPGPIHKIDNTWSVERIAREAPPVTWEKAFTDAIPELHDISGILADDAKVFGRYYPDTEDVFATFHRVQLQNVKLVIIGQDPYHQTITVGSVAKPRAIGSSFSVRRGDKIPSSSQNIFLELSNSVRGFVSPDHGDLGEWEKQGVLLLNMSLTVRPDKPGSHGDIWLGFAKKIFNAIAAVNPYCIYLLWGQQAQKMKTMVGEKSIILEAAHPSGFSARKGFFGCDHFNKANDILIRQGKVAINWKISSLSELSGMHKNAPPPALTHVNHKPTLVPISENNFPTIINRPQLPQQLPIMIGNISNNIGVLPIIPNTKEIIKKSPPTALPVTTTGPVVTPVIPKIDFGKSGNQECSAFFGRSILVTPPLTSTMPLINLPQIIQPTSPPIPIEPLQIRGLPLIPSLVNPK